VVYNRKDGVLAFVCRQSSDEVHCDSLEGECSFFSCDLVEGDFGAMCEDLVLLAYHTAFDIICYPGIHPIP
jgi:hypothetical protein